MTAPVHAPMCDVIVTGAGSVYLFALLTDEARDWVHHHVSRDRQMFGGALAVEHRYVGALARGMQDADLLVSGAGARDPLSDQF